MAELTRVKTEDQHSAGDKKTSAKHYDKAHHPKYIDMVKDAIVNLKQPRGALTHNILNYICANYELGNRNIANRSMNIALKTGVQNGYFDKVGRYADKYALTDKSKITLKTSCVTKHSKTSSRISEGEIEGTAEVANMDTARLDLTSCINTSESSVSTLLRPTPSESDGAFECSRSSHDSSLLNLKTMRVQHKDRLKVKTRHDRRECSITAMDITFDGRILLADHGNKRVKLLDKDGHHLASLVVAKHPSDISAMSNDVAVVALNCMSPLLCLNIKDCIKIDQSIEDTSSAMYISCYNNKIVTMCWGEPKTVKLINVNGHVYWSRSLTDQGQPLFKMPFYTSLYQDNGVYKIIISDYLDFKKSKLIILNGEDGSIVQCIKLTKSLKAGIINGPGGSPSLCYYQMSDTKINAWESHPHSSRILISERHGLGPYPRFMKYSELTKHIIVGYCGLSESRNYMDIFSVVSETSRINT